LEELPVGSPRATRQAADAAGTKWIRSLNPIEEVGISYVGKNLAVPIRCEDASLATCAEDIWQTSRGKRITVLDFPETAVPPGTTGDIRM